MTRVLHVGKFYPPAPGGMERILQLLCEHERPAIDSRVLVAGDGLRTVRETVHGVPVTRVGRVGRIGSVGVCPTFPLKLRRLARDADVVVVHEPNPVALVSTVVARPRGRVIVWFHSEVVRPAWKYRLLYRPFLRAVLRRAERIVVSSPRLAEHAVELQDFRDKCVVIPFGIDRRRFAATPAVAARAAAIRRAHPGPLALFVGRLVPYKGVDVLLRALPGTGIHALVVGDGPERGALEALARELRLERVVTWVGEVDDAELLAHYHACDVFVLPSVTRAEAFGVVQLEAMACGKPVISTALASGVPWVNQHAVTGLVVPPADVGALTEAVAYLAANASARAAWGAAALARVEREFTIAGMVARTADLYRGVARGRRPSGDTRRDAPAAAAEPAVTVRGSGG